MGVNSRIVRIIGSARSLKVKRSFFCQNWPSVGGKNPYKGLVHLVHPEGLIVAFLFVAIHTNLANFVYLSW